MNTEYTSRSPVFWAQSVHLKIEVGWTSNFDFLFQCYNIHCWGTALFQKSFTNEKWMKKSTLMNMIIIQYYDHAPNTMTVPRPCEG